MTMTTDTGANADIRARWFVRALWLIAAAIAVGVGSVGLVTFARFTGEGVVPMGAAWSDDGQRVILQSPDEAALAAGVQPGDVLVGINGIPVGSRVERRHLPAVVSAPLGDPVTFTVQHANATTQNITLTADMPRLALGRVFASIFGLSAARGLGITFEIALFAAFISVAALLSIRRRDNLMALLAAAALMTLGARSSAFHLALLQAYGEIGTPIMLTTAYPLVIIVGLYLLWFPIGHFRRRWEIAFFIVYSSVELVISLTSTIQIYYAVVPFFYITMVSLMVRRYRSEFSAVQRQQAKWLIIGVVLGVLGFFIPGAVNAYLGDAAYLTVYVFGRLLVVGVPITIAFAVFRYRLYEVDLVLNRGIVFGGVTGALGVAFVGVFGLLNAIFGGLLGADQDALAVALSTAAVILLYNPTRKRVQLLVDRRVFGLRIGMDAMRREQDWEHEPTKRINKRASNTIEIPKPDHNAALALTQIGGYTLQSILGRGGMGEVYHGEDHSTGRMAAIKILRGDMAHSQEFRARFEREAKTLSALDHPNIVQIISYGVEDERFYMVLEYIEGQTLAEYLSEHKPLSLERAVPLLSDVAAALDYAHSRQIVHRDVKPRNVMLRQTDDSLRAVLMDFGIVKWLDGTVSLGGALTDGQMIGTVDYAAPEQITAANEIDGRADIYALGVMAYAMLTGELPFKGNVGQIIFAHLQQPPPDPRNVNPMLSDATAGAIIRCLAKKPTARFQTAGAFVDMLKPVESLEVSA